MHFKRARACLPVSLTRSLTVNPQSFRPSRRWIMRSSLSPNADLAAALILTCHPPPPTPPPLRLLSVRLSVSLIEMLAHTKERGTRACCVSRNDTVSQTGSRTDTQQPHMAAHAVGGFPADGKPAGSPSTPALVLYHGSKITHVSLAWCLIVFLKGGLSMLRAFKMQR